MVIFKILPRELWSKADVAGVFHGASIDLQDGFIHLSAPHQVRETANKHFAGQTDLVLAAFEADKLGAALKWEVSRGGNRFPHLYAPLATASALWVRPLPLGADGAHDFAGLLA